MLKLGTMWCAGLALLLIPSPWAWLYAALGTLGAVAWATEPGRSLQ